MTAYANVIADSVSPEGHRLTTFEVRFHRFVLAEFNTHRVFSRNSASSRAIPVTKQLAKFIDDPAYPLEWPSEIKGMQGGPELTGADRAQARTLFEDWYNATTAIVANYIEQHPLKEEGAVRLHKSLINRLLEPMQWHTVIVTATGWDNFFRQRVSPLAQPEIREPALMMSLAYDASVPQELKPGEFHLPYVGDDDETIEWAHQTFPWEEAVRNLVRISTARCARVSYLTHDGGRDPLEDLAMHTRLISADPMHVSPLEHAATPADWNVQEVMFLYDETKGWIHHDMGTPYPSGSKTKVLTLPKVGNFLGWQQHRLEVELNAGRQSFS